jgi:DNA-binding transcriptional MerR regulator
MSAKVTLTIGELAACAGVTPDTLRYYERLGVIARVHRTTGGFRVYSAEVVDRLRFIKQAQRQGLTLAEIRELLRLDTRRGAGQCQRVQRLLERKLVDLDARLAEMQEFRRTLDRIPGAVQSGAGRNARRRMSRTNAGGGWWPSGGF